MRRWRTAQSFEAHPEVSRQEFLLHALERELADRRGPKLSPWHRAAAVGEIPMGHLNSGAKRPTDLELRAAGMLAMRAMAIHRRRYALWPRLQRLVKGGRM